MPVISQLSEQLHEPAASSHAAPNQEALRRVLYIGDDPQKSAAWSEALSQAGYSVTTADSPAAGLSAYVERRFDGVFLAFHRPAVSSGLLGTVMRLFRRSTPLVLLSDCAASDDEELAPFDRVFPKNTAPAVVIGSLHGLMERASSTTRPQMRRFPAPQAESSERS
jgi:DNA-binding response OmpR family regulator